MAGTPEQHLWILRNQLETVRNKLSEQGKALEEETRQKTVAQSENDQAKAELQKSVDLYNKLNKHTKNCEQAASKAQKDARHAKGNAEHLIKSQKGNLVSAERRAEEATKALKEWRDKYGWSVDKPAEEKSALEHRVSEWQSKAEKARNEIALLEQQIQGTPERIGLHQALEQWDEHQGCSAEFAKLEDKVHDGLVLKQNLESELASSKERYQKAKSDVKALKTKADQLEQANKALQAQQVAPEQLEEANQAFQQLKVRADKLDKDNKALKEVQVTPEQLEQANKTFQELQYKADQLEQANKALQETQVAPEQLENAEKAFRELQSKVDLLEQANKALQNQDGNPSKEQFEETESNMKALQRKAERLESDLKDAKGEQQKTTSLMEVLQGKSQQLESDLKNAREQHLTTESQMEVLRGNTARLESDLKNAQEQNPTTESQMEVFRGDTTRLESDLKNSQKQNQTTKSQMEVLRGDAARLESDLKIAQEQHQTTKSRMEVLQVKVDQLEQANGKFKEMEDNNRLTRGFEKKGQEEKENVEMAKAVPQHMNLMDQAETSEKPEQHIKTQQPQIESPKKAEGSQVTPPSSPKSTTDEGSQDLENTPRPKKSLRQDLGYSSRDQSDEEQFGVWTQQEQDAMMLKKAKTGEEKEGLGASTRATDNLGVAEKPTRLSTRWGVKKPLSMERHAKEVLTAQAKGRAKELPEALESIFECTPAKAYAINRSLRILGPGSRHLEAPALIAHELSGIPKDTYKGLASGQLIATMARNEAKDMGTNPDIFANDMATDTSDLPTKEVTGPRSFAKDVVTDTTGLSNTKSSRWTVPPFIVILLMILFGLLGYYMALNSDSNLEAPQGLLYKNIYSHRYTPFPSPSPHASPPITFVHPPVPAQRLGLAGVMGGSLLGGGLRGRVW